MPLTRRQLLGASLVASAPLALSACGGFSTSAGVSRRGRPEP